MALNINTLTQKQLANMTDPKRGQYRQYIDMLTALTNYKCDRTGKEFGPVDKFGQDRVVVFDSLSGAALAALNLVTGSTPLRSKSEWGMSMDALERFVVAGCMSIQCPFVLIAHETRHTDEETGAFQGISVAAPGQKLAPKIPLYFDDVIYTFRRSKEWLWSTNYPGVTDLKSRHLGIFDAAPPSFAPLVAEWRKQVAAPTA